MNLSIPKRRDGGPNPKEKAAVLLLMFGTDLQMPLLTFRTTLLKGLDIDATGLSVIAAAAALIYGLCDSFRWKSSIGR